MKARRENGKLHIDSHQMRCDFAPAMVGSRQHGIGGMYA